MKEYVLELKKQIFPILFSIASTCWALNSLFNGVLIKTLGCVTLIHVFLFIEYNYVKKKKLPGVVLFFASSLLYMAAAFIILSITNAAQGVSYFYWFIVSQPEDGNFIFGFWLGTVLLAAYGFCSTIYYFSEVKFRVAVLFIIGIIPFLLQSAKSEREITPYFIIYVVLFFVMYVERTRKKSGGGSGLKCACDRWYMAAMMLFISIILALSYIIPKPYTAPKILLFDNVLNQAIQPLSNAVRNAMQGQNYSTFNPGILKGESRISAFTAPLGDRVLFTIEADEPLYFRVQSWEKYEKNKWYTDSEFLEIGNSFENFSKRQLNLATTVSTLDKMVKLSPVPSEISSLQDVQRFPSTAQTIKKATVIPNEAYLTSYLNPPGITNLKTDMNRQKVYINENACCFNSDNKVIMGQYSIDYVSQILSPQSREFQLIKKMNKDKAGTIYSAEEYLKGVSGTSGAAALSSQEKLLLNTADTEMDIAYRYYTSLPDSLPQRIYDLADSITAGKTSDYDKAFAIERFFHTSGFKYSLSPPMLSRDKDYNDFFIFESKRGVCVHFASAMVLLARACGLPARYVEGFIANERDSETGRYIIREKNGHAFPEVYIAGYGWMVFEPTVGMAESDSDFYLFIQSIGSKIKYLVSNVVNFIIYLPFWVKTLFIPLAAVVLMAMISAFIRLREKIWRKRMGRISKKQALEEIFARIAHLLGKINLDIKIHETPSAFAKRISEEGGVTLVSLSDAFNKARYGGVEPSDEDMKKASEAYAQVAALVKKRIGKLKS
jgi:hypothetical protein